MAFFIRFCVVIKGLRYDFLNNWFALNIISGGTVDWAKKEILKIGKYLRSPLMIRVVILQELLLEENMHPLIRVAVFAPVDLKALRRPCVSWDWLEGGGKPFCIYDGHREDFLGQQGFSPRQFTIHWHFPAQKSMALIPLAVFKVLQVA